MSLRHLHTAGTVSGRETTALVPSDFDSTGFRALSSSKAVDAARVGAIYSFSSFTYQAPMSVKLTRVLDGLDFESHSCVILELLVLNLTRNTLKLRSSLLKLPHVRTDRCDSFKVLAVEMLCQNCLEYASMSDVSFATVYAPEVPNISFCQWSSPELLHDYRQVSDVQRVAFIQGLRHQGVPSSRLYMTNNHI